MGDKGLCGGGVVFLRNADHDFAPRNSNRTHLLATSTAMHAVLLPRMAEDGEAEASTAAKGQHLATLNKSIFT